MAKKDVNAAIVSLKELLSGDDNFVREAVRGYLQDVLEEEMTAAVGGGKGERSLGHLGYRSGYYERALVMRVGRIELRVPQDRDGRFSTDLFERCQRSEKALVSALTEMYVQDVSTRKVKRITEELCGYQFSASTISDIVRKLDEQLRAFARRWLDEPFPYPIVDARYEKVRENGVIVSQTVLIALGIDWEGRRQVLAVELANRESASSWKEFLRGLSGVGFTVSDDHAGLKKAIAEVLPEAVWQRRYVHFLRNALDHMPRKRDDDCLQELRWLYDRRDLSEAKRDLAAWVEDSIEETLAFYRLPRQHRKHLKSTNMLERCNQEIERRTHVVRVFPNAESCPRSIRALAVETHEDWLEANRYINMKLLEEHKRELLKEAA